MTGVFHNTEICFLTPFLHRQICTSPHHRSSSSSLAPRLCPSLGSNCSGKKPSSSKARGWGCREEQPLSLQSSCFLLHKANLVTPSSPGQRLGMRGRGTAESSRREWQHQSLVMAGTVPSPALQRPTAKWRERKWNC